MSRLLSAILLSAALGLAACGEKASAPPTAVQATGQRFVVRLSEIPDFKPAAATAATKDMAEARARIGGTLVRLLVDEGDVVRKGQLVGLVVDDRIGLQTAAYDAEVAAAQAGYDRAQADLKRTRILFDKGIYAQARLDQDQAAAKAAAGGLNAARAQRDASAAASGQGAILAPADGKVTRVSTPVGSVVTPGQSVAVLTAGAPVLRIEVPEREGAGLAVGQAVALAGDDGRPTGAVGTITQVYPAVTAGRLVADVQAPGMTGDRLGQKVSVLIPLGRRSAVLVPSRFVFSRYGLDYVLMLRRDGSAAQAPVQATPSGLPGQVEILSGVSPGDTLIAPAGAGR